MRRESNWTTAGKITKFLATGSRGKTDDSKRRRFAKTKLKRELRIQRTTRKRAIKKRMALEKRVMAIREKTRIKGIYRR